MICNKCPGDKDPSEFTGYRKSCNECEKERSRKYYQRNKAKVKKAQRAYYMANTAEIRERNLNRYYEVEV